MPSGLQQLLDSIDPDRTLDEVDRRTGRAINTFRQAPAHIAGWHEFRVLLTRFVRHVERHVLRLPSGWSSGGDLDFDWGRCCQILTTAYGRNGEKAAFEMARTGNEGGLRAVLKRVARSMAERFADNEISSKVNRYWEGLSAEERLAASEEYLCGYGHLLPSELTEGSAARIRANLPRVLEQHPRLMQRLRGVART